MPEEEPQRNPQCFHPITALPLFASLIDDEIEDFEKLTRDLNESRQGRRLLDDVTVDRILRAHAESLELADGFDHQLARWAGEDGTASERSEVTRLQQQMHRYRAGCLHILDLAEELKKGTIDAILRMSDEEVGLAVLLGKLPPARRP